MQVDVTDPRQRRVLVVDPRSMTSEMLRFLLTETADDQRIEVLRIATSRCGTQSLTSFQTCNAPSHAPEVPHLWGEVDLAARACADLQAMKDMGDPPPRNRHERRAAASRRRRSW